MGLIYWLPMTDGTAKNQGLADATITVNNVTVNASGKLGQCCVFDSTNVNSNIEISNYDLSSVFSGDWTVSFWIYDNKNGGRSCYCTTYNYGGQNGIALEKKSSQQFRIWYRGGSSSIDPTTNVIVENQTWIHFTVVKVDDTVTVYKNGENVYSFTSPQFEVFPENKTAIGIGNDTRGSVTGLVGMMNDLRIYDNALSPREIKEISKGLVLHYPLAMPGQENLIKNSKQKTIGPATTSYNYSTVATGLTIGETYTFSAVVDLDGTDNKKCTIYNYNSKESSDGCPVTSHFIADGITRDSWTFTAVNSNIVVYAGVAGSTSGIKATYKNIKLERGSTPTPWLPNPTDAEYSALGFDDGIEYDVSGYGYNGTKTGVFAYDADTPRYNTSTRFNLTDTRITPPIIFQSGAKIPEISFSFWMKRNDYTDAKSHYIYNDICQIYTYSDYLLRISWKHDTESSSTGNISSSSSAITTPNEWHHICYTFDKGILRLYIDGEFKYDSDRTGTGQFMGVYNYRSIGYASGSNISYGGCLSDFRIYATALSADDVMALYHTPISLANNGALLTQGEYVES